MKVQPTDPSFVAELYRKRQEEKVFMKEAQPRPSKRPKESGKGDRIDVQA